MKTFVITITITAEDALAEELKNEILSGTFQKGLKDNQVKTVKATYHEINNN